MGRAPCCDKANVKKGPWAPEEDAKLRRFIQINGTGGNWITLPSKAGLRRCGKSCRLRWTNYLRPDIRHGKFTEEEEKLIIDWHGKVGSRWSLIAAQLQGRTDNDIKNYWNTRLKKKLAEKGMNSSLSHHQQQHHSYHMRSVPVPMFAVGVSGMSQPGGIRQSPMSKDQLIDHQTAQYLEQQRYNAAQLAIQQSRPATLFTQGHELEPQWQGQSQILPMKHVYQPEVSHPERFRTIHSELLNIITPEVSDSMTSTQTSDILHQQSPISPCSNWSPDTPPYGLEDSSYSDNFNNICGDPPPLVDVQSHPLPPVAVELSSPVWRQQLASATRSSGKEDPAFAASKLCDMFAVMSDFPGVLGLDLSDAQTTSLVKEEMCTDFSTSSELIPSPTTRGFPSSRTWPTASQRCGERLSAGYQAQMLPSQPLDAFSEQVGFIYPNSKYVSI